MFRLIPRFLIIFSVLFIACDDSGLVQQPRDIETAKQKWESFGHSDYSMEVDRSCFCAAPSRFTAIIENNEIVQVIDTETGEKIELQFHPVLGYPTFIDYNQSDMIADEELLMKIENLKRK